MQLNWLSFKIYKDTITPFEDTRGAAAASQRKFLFEDKSGSAVAAHRKVDKNSSDASYWASQKFSKKLS